MSSQQRSLADPRQDEYRTLHEADLRDYLMMVEAAAFPTIGAVSPCRVVILAIDELDFDVDHRESDAQS
jgi:hypothetical protein